MNIQENINSISNKMAELDSESKRLQGALEVMYTLQKMGVKVVNPENTNDLKNIPEDEVIDEPARAEWTYRTL